MRKQFCNLILFLTLIKISICYTDLCTKLIDVRTIDSSQEFETICTECPKNQRASGYTYNSALNDKYECVGIQDPFESNYLDCKRVNNRFTCQEQLQQCSVLLQNNDIASSYDCHCAIVAEDLSTCVMPKFGYTLILPSGQFDIMNQTFCAIFNSNTGKCIKYHHRFLPVKDAGYSVFFKDFFNFDKIIHEQSHSSQIVCEKDYKLEFINGIQGCLPLTSNDLNCMKWNEYQSCQQCKDGYSINAKTGICEQSLIDNCLFQNTYNNKQICQLCNMGFALSYNKCTKINNCAQFNQLPPYNCLNCKHPFQSKFCDSQGSVMDQCEINEIWGSCLRCKNNDFFFLKNLSKCQIRITSQNCKVKHPFGDYCGQLNQSDMIYYDDNTSFEFRLNPKQYTENYFKQPINVNDSYKGYLLQLGITFYLSDQSVKKITPVDGCAEYSYLSNSCVKCNSGKYLWLYQDKYSCRSEIPPSPSDKKGCLDIDQYNQVCKNCKEKYFLDIQNSNCQPITTPNCIYGISDFYGKEDKCISCEKGYTLDYNSQRKCIKLTFSKKDEQQNNEITCLQGPSFMASLIIKDSIKTCVANTDNCEIMSDDYCIQCFNGFTLNAVTKKCFKSDEFKFCKISTENTCIQCISDDYYILKNNKCTPYCKEKTSCFDKYPHCSECFKGECTKCDEGYQIYGNQCYSKCSNGQLVQDPKDCNSSQGNCDQNCEQCYQNNQCQICKNGYIMEQYGKCVEHCPDGTYYNQTIKSCTFCQANCIKCSEYGSCLECNYPFTNTNGQCLPTCKDGKVVIDFNQCYECPEGFFFDYIPMKCTPCNSQCKTCSSFDKCSTCIISNATPDNNCSCKNGQLLQGNQCVMNCPFGSTANLQNNQCERLCASTTYPVYYVNRKEYECESVLNEQSDYCQQFIEQIPQSLKIQLKKVNQSDENLNLYVTFFETPQECYSYQLFGKPSFEIPLEKLHNSTIHQTFFDIKISKSDILNINKVEQNEKYSFLYFKIFYKDYLQYTLRIKITFTFDLILSNELQYTGEHQMIDPVCEDCEIPREKQVQSSTIAKCPSDAQCDNGKISVYTNADLEITQQITDPKYSKNTLQPHSLKMKFIDSNGKESISQIKNYYYDNSELGKIKYTLKAIGGSNGQLIVTSKIYSAFSESRILESSQTSKDSPNTNYKYSTQVFDLEYQDQDQEDSDSNQLGQLEIIIICVFCTLIGCVILMLSIYYICLKKKQNKAKSYIDNQQQNAKIEKAEEPVEIIKFDESYE